MLKNSDRNSIENRSVIGNFLNTEKSKRWTPGPTVLPGLEPRAAAPFSGKHPVGESGTGARLAGLTPSHPSLQGWLKALGLFSQKGRGAPSMVLILMPRCWLWPGTVTVTQPTPAADPVGQPKLSGCPPCAVTIQLTAQPPRTALVMPPWFMYFIPLPKGNWYPPLKWTTWRTS